MSIKLIFSDTKQTKFVQLLDNKKRDIPKTFHKVVIYSSS